MEFSAPAAGLVIRLVEPSDADVRDTLGREIEGLGEVLSAWGRFQRPVHVAIARTQAELRNIAPCSTELQLHAVAALDGLLLLAPDAWATPPARVDLEKVLLHELAHVLLFQRCAPATATASAYLPTWFREGMATVVAAGRPNPGLRRTLAGHPLLEDLPGAGDAVMADDPEACYLAAALLFQAWMDRFGPMGLSALCRAMRAGHGFGAAHDRACGVPEPVFVRDWLGSVQHEARTA